MYLFVWGFVTDSIYARLLSTTVVVLRNRIKTAVEEALKKYLPKVLDDFGYLMEIVTCTSNGLIEKLK